MPDPQKNYSAKHEYLTLVAHMPIYRLWILLSGFFKSQDFVLCHSTILQQRNKCAYVLQNNFDLRPSYTIAQLLTQALPESVSLSVVYNCQGCYAEKNSINYSFISQSINPKFGQKQHSEGGECIIQGQKIKIKTFYMIATLLEVLRGIQRYLWICPNFK